MAEAGFWEGAGSGPVRRSSVPVVYIRIHQREREEMPGDVI